ncbi:pimeloyl-ACP methyl ester carboxylesterase [Haloferula luteola]|uniref:Pimeloyl-ACP methyl ester carboxylesterase n=1 Tax=Haloferula luteola TaxID=595692 RepID=A0A840VHC4_9BACT|nr:alpha/beta hydrolase [Haloferula luteola]MBB5353219.1 pimeloyl-ACP methyl ester carboxylesterase [Haloferula luteola]
MKENERVELPDGRHLGFAEYGDPDGKPVMYFHGWPSSRYQAAFTDGPARERGLRILAPDRPGVGLSDPLPGRHFSDWPGDVAAFADALGIGSFSILGISGGGPYALASCVALPERIERAAMICGAPPLAEKSDRSHMHWAYRSLAGLKSFRRHAVPWVIPLSEWMIGRGAQHPPMSWMLKSVPPRDREALFTSGGWDMVTRSYLEAVRNGCDAMLTEGELYLEPWDFRPEEIRVPMEIWHGTQDANLPCEVAQRLCQRIPTAHGNWIEGEGHYSIAVFYSNAALDWLAAGSGIVSLSEGVGDEPASLGSEMSEVAPISS